MDFVNNSYLTIDEKILLESLEETDTSKALGELENLIAFVPTDDESYLTLLALRDKLRTGHINIEQELENLPDEDEVFD